MSAFKPQIDRDSVMWAIGMAEAMGGPWPIEPARMAVSLAWDDAHHPTRPVPFPSREEFAVMFGWMTKPTKKGPGGSPAVKRVSTLLKDEARWKPQRTRKGNEKDTEKAADEQENADNGEIKDTGRTRKGHAKGHTRGSKPASNLQPPVVMPLSGFLKSPLEGKSAPVDSWMASLALWGIVSERSARMIRANGKGVGMGAELAKALRVHGPDKIIRRLRWVAFCGEHPIYDPTARCEHLRERGDLTTLLTGRSRAQYDLWADLWNEDGCPHIDGATAAPAAHGGEGSHHHGQQEVRAEDYDLEPEELEGMGFRVIVGGVE